MPEHAEAERDTTMMVRFECTECREETGTIYEFRDLETKKGFDDLLGNLVTAGWPICPECGEDCAFCVWEVSPSETPGHPEYEDESKIMSPLPPKKRTPFCEWLDKQKPTMDEIEAVSALRGWSGRDEEIERLKKL